MIRHYLEANVPLSVEERGKGVAVDVYETVSDIEPEEVRKFDRGLFG